MAAPFCVRRAAVFQDSKDSSKKDREKMLKLELALALYQRGVISLGKARKLAEIGKWEFIDEL